MFPPGTSRCGCFLNCPGDMEKAAHTFGQMPDGLSGQFSFGRAWFPSEEAALTCVVVLAPSWPLRAWGLCCPQGSSRLPLAGPGGRGAGGWETERLCSTSDRALLSVWKSHFQTSLRLRSLRVLIQRPGLAAARGGGGGRPLKGPGLV